MKKLKKKIRLHKKRHPSIRDLYDLGISTKILSIHVDAQDVEIVFDGEPTEQEKKVLEKIYSQGIVEITFEGNLTKQEEKVLEKIYSQEIFKIKRK